MAGAYTAVSAPGVTWAPKLPAHWRAAKLRWLASIYAGGTPSKDVPEYWAGGDVPWLNSGAVNDWEITTPSTYISSAALRNSSARWIPARSVVIALAGQGRTKGMAARLEIESTCNQSMAAIVPGPVLDYRFLQYWLTSNYQSIRNMAGGDNRDGLNLQHIGDIEVPLPPIEEQRRIANFLDDQSANIDNIVAARRRQIALTIEHEEQALESLLWPAGSVDVELRRLGTSVTTGPFGTVFAATEYVTGGVPMINPTHIVDGTLVPDANHSVSLDTAHRLARHRLHAGDVITGRKGDLGRSALVTIEQEGWICGSDSIAIHVDQSQLVPAYLDLLLHLPRLRSELVALSPGATMPSLNEGMLLSLKLPAASLDEQLRVSSQASELRHRHQAIREALRRSIEALKGCRHSLISASVTGQLETTAASGRGVA